MKRHRRHAATHAAVDESMTTAVDALAVLAVLAVAVIGFAFAV